MTKTLLRLMPGILLCWFLSLLLSVEAQNLVPVPPLQARVTDQAGMLQPEQRATLENVLQEYETRTGNQIAILLVKSTAPEVIEQYSIRVADEWKLGRKGIDDGVILIVAKDNPAGLRRLRIESGRGVQGVLTDAQSKRILQDIIAPHFRQNDFYGGLAAGVSAITGLLDQEKFSPPDGKTEDQEERSAWLPFIIFGIFIILAIARSRRSRRLSQHGWGRSSGIILGGGLGGFGKGDNGGFSGGDGGFSGGDGGFSGGDGGFSGGGGGFDGGGASGDW